MVVDAPVAREKPVRPPLPSPLRDADGNLVPCSCRFSATCALAGGQTACSSYWYLASTSAPAKFPIRLPEGHIKHDVKEKKPGSKLHEATIQRTIQPGEKLMCSSCYQQKAANQKVQTESSHHTAPALATAWVNSSHCGVRIVRATGGG